MKEIGKVKEYDGHDGKISNQEGVDFYVKKEDVIGEPIQQDDNVLFVPETYQNAELKENIARFVRKLKK